MKKKVKSCGFLLLLGERKAFLNMDFKLHFLGGAIEVLFFAEYDDKILMLDGGSRPDVPVIENFITGKLGRKISDLKLVVVSHMHPDHAGAAYFLRKKYGIPIAAHPEADLWYEKFCGALQQRLDIFLASYVAKKRLKKNLQFLFPKKINPDFILQDNQPLPFFPDWKVIYAPGHTSHQIVLYHPQEKILYAADVLIKLKDGFKLPFPTELKLFAKNTLLKLSKLPVKKLLLAHGGIITPQDSEKLFLSLIEQLDEKNLAFQMKLLKIFTAHNPPLKKYKRLEKRKIKSS